RSISRPCAGGRGGFAAEAASAVAPRAASASAVAPAASVRVDLRRMVISFRSYESVRSASPGARDIRVTLAALRSLEPERKPPAPHHAHPPSPPARKVQLVRSDAFR